MTGDAELALTLLAIDPQGLGGAVIRGDPRHAIAALRRLLPKGTPVLKLPAHTGADRILGGLDIAASLSAGHPIAEPGLLAQADGGMLAIPSAERLDLEKAALVAAALDIGGLAVIAFDESHGDGERVPVLLEERLAFRVAIDDAVDVGDAETIAKARATLPRIAVPDAIAAALCEAALALGARSLRAAIFAVAAAKALAAFEGADTVDDEHAAAAARLVLAPRATRRPAPPEEDAQDADDPAETESAEEQRQSEVDDLTEIVLEAVIPALPAGLLNELDTGAQRSTQKTGAGAVSKRSGQKRGRPIGSRPGQLGGHARLALIDTLRAAAPWQRLRAAPSSTRPGVQVRKQDFRIQRFKQRQETTAIFVVDASGSAAAHRLAEAKGAVELILADCYVRRDQIALIAFRGKQAEVLLPPTRSLQRAKRALSGLPGGGGTPLGDAIVQAMMVADRVRRRGGTPLAVFLTDGRANIARDGSANRELALTESRDAARSFRIQGLRGLVIDVSAQPHEAAKSLAATMAAAYLPLPYANAAAISAPVARAMQAGA